MFDKALIPSLCGWRPDRAAIEAYLTSLPHPTVSSAHPDAVRRVREVSEDYRLWDAAKAVLGRNLECHDQQRGTCVSHGWSLALDYQQLHAIASGRGDVDYRPVSHASVYGFSREVAGILGDEDGSYGAAAAESLARFGVLSNEETGDSDTDNRLAVAWGKTGVPADRRASAKTHASPAPVLVSTLEELRASLSKGVAVPLCSNQGFTLVRDAQGFCEASGSWAHCMACVGYIASVDGYVINQSWGPNMPSGPLPYGMPGCCFLARSRVVARMLRAGDSFAPFGFVGWKKSEPTPTPTPAEMVLILGQDTPAGRYILKGTTHGVLRQELPGLDLTTICDAVNAVRKLSPTLTPFVVALLNNLCPQPSASKKPCDDCRESKSENGPA